MVVLVENMRVVGKNYRRGNNSRGDWELYELQCGTGEGATVNLNTTKDIYDSVEVFTPYTAKINLFAKGYNLGGEILEVWPD